MKKLKHVTSILCLSVFAMVLCTVTVAQEQKTASEGSLTPKFGIKAGVNLANLYIDNVEDENMKVGLNAGLFAKLPVSKGFSIQPELLYSNKGSKITYNNPLLGSGEYRFNLHYAELPVLAVINVAKNFNIHFGPYASYLMAANITDVNEDGTVDEISDLDADSFERFDWGLAGGIGVDAGKFTIGARYNYGLRELSKSGSVASQLTPNSKNSVIALYLGLAF